MEQQTNFLRRVLGLPNPNVHVIPEQSDDISTDLGNSCDGKVTSVVFNDDSTSNGRCNSKLNHKDPLFFNREEKYKNSNSTYLQGNKNCHIRAHFGNEYWKRDMFLSGESRPRKLWKQPESNYDHSFKSKSTSRSKSICNNNFKEPTSKLNNQYDKNNKKQEYRLEQELLDEDALEAFPSFEESKLHRLQKNILKAPLMQTTPIKKESVEEIKMKFQLWSNNLTTSSSVKKKDAKKNDLAQIRIMKPPLRIIRNGINRMFRENDDWRLELIYESIIKDDLKNVNNINRPVNGFKNTQSADNYVSNIDMNLNNVINRPQSPAIQNKTVSSNFNSRFLVSKNLNLPKAFGRFKCF